MLIVREAVFPFYWQPPKSFAMRTRWVCPWLPASSISGRDCTHFPTTVGTQSKHATTL